MSKTPKLSPRQEDVARLLVRGWLDKEVASLLEISPATVRHHLGELRRKFDARNKLHLVAILAVHVAPGTPVNCGSLAKLRDGFTVRR